MALQLSKKFKGFEDRKNDSEHYMVDQWGLSPEVQELYKRFNGTTYKTKSKELHLNPVITGSYLTDFPAEEHLVATVTANLNLQKDRNLQGLKVGQMTTIPLPKGKEQLDPSEYKLIKLNLAENIIKTIISFKGLANADQIANLTKQQLPNIDEHLEALNAHKHKLGQSAHFTRNFIMEEGDTEFRFESDETGIDAQSSQAACYEAQNRIQYATMHGVQFYRRGMLEQDKINALVMFGSALHTLQDSFSEAHAGRQKIKADKTADPRWPIIDVCSWEWQAKEKIGNHYYKVCEHTKREAMQKDNIKQGFNHALDTHNNDYDIQKYCESVAQNKKNMKDYVFPSNYATICTAKVKYYDSLLSNPKTDTPEKRYSDATSD